MAKTSDWKETVRRALSDAVNRGHKVTAIAKAVGTTRQNLHAFLSTGYLGGEFVRGLETWLQENEFLDTGTNSRAESKMEPALIVASELRALASFLESPDFDNDTKVERFCIAIRGYHSSLKAFETALKKSKQ